MNVIAINASPRKTCSTASLLENAVKGAQSQNAAAELIHLYDLQFKGCVSCFECKLKDKGGEGVCALKDGLSPVLEKVMESDVLLLGSPIYYGDVTGVMRCFMERLFFMNLTYDDPHRKVPGKAISSAFFFTMNLSKEEGESYYTPLFEMASKVFECLGGSSEYLASFETYQFDDYSKYTAGIFDVANREKVRREQFPKDCKKAFEIGARLAQR